MQSPQPSAVRKTKTDLSLGFAPIAQRDARILILGSLPGEESLRLGQYYAYRHNAFWKIMGELVGAMPELPYAKRLQHLNKNRIALWDVCAAAERKGSLDSNIREPQANDFTTFFEQHRKITKVCFNGQPAEKLFRRLVLPHMSPCAAAMDRVILPSTSPAHAGMPYVDKLRLWREALMLWG